MATLLSGAAFGAAMIAAGFYQPAVVVSQFKLQDWHMIQTFLAATATSALVYAAAERLGYVKLQPRSSSPLGLFSRYDGNVLGGALLGAGMALSGSCPGTLLAQVAAGVRTGFYALDGAILGGIAWTGGLGRLVKARGEAAGVKAEAATVDGQLGLSKGLTLVLFEAALAAAAAATVLYGASNSTSVYPGLVGGVFIGLAQLFSIASRRTMMGVSGSYEEAGQFFWWLARGGGDDGKPASHRNVVFAAGVAAGAWAMARAVPELVAAPAVDVAPVLATVGGAVMIIGSRMAGGCTSGHGISGMSLFSVSSFVTIASAFAVGAAVAPLVH